MSQTTVERTPTPHAPFNDPDVETEYQPSRNRKIAGRVGAAIAVVAVAGAGIFTFLKVSESHRETKNAAQTGLLAGYGFNAHHIEEHVTGSANRLKVTCPPGTTTKAGEVINFFYDVDGPQASLIDPAPHDADGRKIGADKRITFDLSGAAQVESFITDALAKQCAALTVS